MKSKTSKITLRSLYELMISKFADSEMRDNTLDRKITGIYGEIDLLKHQQIETDDKISSLNNKVDSLNNKVDNTHNKIDNLRKEMNDNFTGVYDGLSQLAVAIDKNIEPRIKSLEKKAGVQATN